MTKSCITHNPVVIKKCFLYCEARANFSCNEKNYFPHLAAFYFALLATCIDSTRYVNKSSTSAPEFTSKKRKSETKMKQPNLDKFQSTVICSKGQGMWFRQERKYSHIERLHLNPRLWVMRLAHCRIYHAKGQRIYAALTKIYINLWFLNSQLPL